MTTYEIIYTSANGTQAYERKTERGARSLQEKLLSRDMARNVVINRIAADMDGTTVTMINSRRPSPVGVIRAGL